MLEYLKEYINARFTLAKLEVVEHTGKGVARAASSLVLAGFLFISYLLIIIGLAWYLGQHILDNLPLGFILMGLIQFAIFLILFYFRKSVIQRTALNLFIRVTLKDFENDHS